MEKKSWANRGIKFWYINYSLIAMMFYLQSFPLIF